MYNFLQFRNLFIFPLAHVKGSKVHVSSFGPYFTENKDVHVELISDGSCRTVILITGVEEMVVMQEWY